MSRSVTGHSFFQLRCALLLVLWFFYYGLAAQPVSQETNEQKDQRMEWWRDATFGLFIHWGVYSIPAGMYEGKKADGTGEWIMENAHIPIPEYEEFVHTFDPQSFDANEWVQLAEDAGVRYIIITSKHHDGFCLWDSNVTTYDIMDATPFKRDILRELSDACKKADMKLGFYYSIMDWHQPEARSEQYPHQQNENADWAHYRENYLKPQLTELITNYDPAVLWFDGEWIDEWTEKQGQDLYAFLRKMKPDLIINNRIGKGRQGMSGMNAYEDAAGDFGTPEQEILGSTTDFDWESCMTMNDTWGYKKNDLNWKSSHDLMYNLVDVTAKGGNYLLNIGPKPDGTIPSESVERLHEMGEWLTINGEAIYGTTSLDPYKKDSIWFTKSNEGDFIYAIVMDNSLKDISLDHRIIPVLRNSAIIRMVGMDQTLQWDQKEKNLNVQLPDASASGFPRVVKIPYSK